MSGRSSSHKAPTADERSPLLIRQQRQLDQLRSSKAAAASSSRRVHSSKDRQDRLEDGRSTDSHSATKQTRSATGNAAAPGARIEAEELPDALTPEERRRSLLRWSAFWLAFGTLVIVLIVLAVKQGGARFDFKGALKKAAGGVRACRQCPMKAAAKQADSTFSNVNCRVLPEPRRWSYRFWLAPEGVAGKQPNRILISKPSFRP